MAGHMPTQTSDVGATRGVQALHGVLLIGLISITTVFALVLRLRHIQELVPGARVAGYVMAGFSVLCLVLAILILRPRVPRRTASDQSTDTYWAQDENRATALTLWVVCEGAGIVSAVGYVMTGNLVPLGTVLLSIVVLVLLGPKTLAAS
jgi:hypothetical protein